MAVFAVCSWALFLLVLTNPFGLELHYPYLLLAKIALVWILGSLLMVTSGGTRFDEPLTSAAEFLTKHSPVLPVLLIGCAFVALVLAITPLVEFGQGKFGLGYGHDGVQYGKMAEELTKAAVKQPWSARVLPSFIVHYLPVETFNGFRIVNIASFFAICLVLVGIQRESGFSTGQILMGTVLFCTLRWGVRWWVYCPVMADAFGSLLLALGFYFMIRGQIWAFSLVLGISVFSRENVLLLIPTALCIWLLERRQRNVVAILLAVLLPVGLYYLSRRYPLVGPPYRMSSLLVSFLWWWDSVLHYWGRLFRAILSWYSAFGMMLVVLVVEGSAVRAYINRHPGLLLYSMLGIALAAGAGADLDRFMTWLFPVVVPLSVMLITESAEFPPTQIGILIAMQCVVSEAVFVWEGAQAFYYSRYVAHCPFDHLYVESGLFLLCLLAVLLAKYGPRGKRLPERAPSS
ncbi:MAG: hypothetical protein AB1646_18125 [Thermodesulfobacteriota bacterium]